MYRETIEHPWSIPEDIKAGAIWKAAAIGDDSGASRRLHFKPPKPVRLGSASTADLVAQLENRNAWQRETAHRLLFKRQDQSAVEPLRKLLNAVPIPLADCTPCGVSTGLGALSDGDLLAGPIRPDRPRP